MTSQTAYHLLYVQPVSKPRGMQSVRKVTAQRGVRPFMQWEADCKCLQRACIVMIVEGLPGQLHHVGMTWRWKAASLREQSAWRHDWTGPCCRQTVLCQWKVPVTCHAHSPVFRHSNQFDYANQEPLYDILSTVVDYRGRKTCCIADVSMYADASSTITLRRCCWFCSQ